MRKLILVYVLLSVLGCSCSREITESIEIDTSKLDSITFQHSMKGWELYSWQTGEEWNYSLLAGTNRAKTMNEITKNLYLVTGKDLIKYLLGKLPENEEILWVGAGWPGIIYSEGTVILSLPDNQTIEEIKGFCLQKKLVMNVYYGK